ncbi:MAG: hypothetical protein U0234_19145 [Sandaracinus sp.]
MLQRVLLGASALVLLSFCGFRQPGLEVALDLSMPASSEAGSLLIERIELLPCPDAVPSPASASILFASVARAHEVPTAIGPLALDTSGGRASALLPVPPGSYCDLRLHLGSPDAPALVVPSGSAAEREVVLRIVDDAGMPTRLVLARAPQRTTIAITLGAPTSLDSAPRMLSEIVGAATARLVVR